MTSDSPDPQPPHGPAVLLAGTRPEALKLIPLLRALPERGVKTVLVDSGQHPGMVAAALAPFGLAPAEGLAPSRGSGSLAATVRGLRESVHEAIRRLAPRLMVVHGDTSTTYAGALAARAAGVPLSHVEAGLRTAHPLRPFPEELFRRRVGSLADLHFAPTTEATANLRREGITGRCVETVGNTIIDVLRETLGRPAPHALRELVPPRAPLVVVTFHRRENVGRRLDPLCLAVLELLCSRPDLHVLCPQHPNPAVRARLQRRFAGHPRITLTDPLPYPVFVHALARAALVVTDSGGIQEEAPYLGVPVLVARENTERPEALTTGTTRLVAADPQLVLDAAHELLAAPRPRAQAFDRTAPFGDGRAGERIARRLAHFIRSRPRTSGPGQPNPAREATA
ncbi:non-hydrolyzing UDP-N-acetylglucosamine 2-epimerase [Kitasatospora sp. NPDC092286]|uniref:non-hydrolyzing UDP-N-acetylglucosamine 2-epimerase n=1 Tax=Kitasatospora sp. NPDC092286 TaxID=3364087 RepID=UPI003826EEAF